MRGTVEFTPWREGTLVTIRLSGLPVALNPSGFFAIHIHEGAICGNNAGPDPFRSAGDHLNLGRQPHPLHIGDLPSLLASRRGEAFARVYTDRFLPRNVVGRTVIIHAGPDDYRTQPAGNAGSRIGCGEINRQ